MRSCPSPRAPSPRTRNALRRQRACGYSEEDLRILLAHGRNGEEPIGSMGTDVPLACLSDRPQSLFNYFKQLFAQVTNPPIDPIREELVMSLISYIGTERNILDERRRTATRSSCLIPSSPIAISRSFAALLRAICSPPRCPRSSAPKMAKRA
jgi:hypothetical protein